MLRRIFVGQVSFNSWAHAVLRYLACTYNIKMTNLKMNIKKHLFKVNLANLKKETLKLRLKAGLTRKVQSGWHDRSTHVPLCLNHEDEREKSKGTK